MDLSAIPDNSNFSIISAFYGHNLAFRQFHKEFNIFSGGPLKGCLFSFCLLVSRRVSSYISMPNEALFQKTFNFENITSICLLLSLY